MFRNLFNTLAFLTILPLNPRGTLTPAEMGRLPGYYPLAGLVLGGFSVALALVGGGLLPPAVLATMIVVCQLVLTRGFHLDGLADAADALLSHKDQEKKLAILKDSHLGTFGVAAIVLSLMLKTTILDSLARGADHGLPPLPALLLYPVWGRLAASVVAAVGSPARADGTGLGFNMVRHGGRRELLFALATSLLATVFFGPAPLACLAASFVLGLVLARVWRAALGGVTGDLLGASVELGEILGLLALAVLW